MRHLIRCSLFQDRSRFHFRTAPSLETQIRSRHDAVTFILDELRHTSRGNLLVRGNLTANLKKTTSTNRSIFIIFLYFFVLSSNFFSQRMSRQTTNTLENIHSVTVVTNSVVDFGFHQLTLHRLSQSLIHGSDIVSVSSPSRSMWPTTHPSPRKL